MGKQTKVRDRNEHKRTALHARVAIVEQLEADDGRTQTRGGRKRAVLYARVSTDEQSNNYSLSSQLEACSKYAESHSFFIVGSFKEDYSGAVPIEQRPEGRKAYAMLAGGEADALIVYTMDRLVRPPDDGDEWDTPILIRSLAKLGKEIHTYNRGKLGTSFAELLIAMMDAKSAGDERRKIIERTSRGRFAKARDGKVVGCGHPPYGYRFVEDDDEVTGFEIVETEAEIVRSMFKWYTGTGGERPLGAYVIATRLSEMGAQTPGARQGRKSKRPGIWNLNSVHRILTNEVYAGVWYYGKRIGNSGDEGRRPQSEQVAVEVPALVSREIWEAAQAQREYNARMSKRNTRREYLLRGMVKCGVCGRAMSGHARSKGSQKRYYVCPMRRSVMPTVGGVPCDNMPYARADVLETKAWEYALDIITDRKGLLAKLRKAQARMLAEVQPKQEELATVEALIAEVEAEADRIAQNMAAIGKGGRVAKSLQHKADEVDERYSGLCKRRDRLHAEIEASIITDESITNIVQFSEDVDTGLNHPTFEDKRRWLEYLRTEVEVKYGKGVVSCMLPVKPRTFTFGTSTNGSKAARSSRA